MTDPAERDNLGAFLKFADDLKEIRDHYERPVWAQTCRCGGSIEVGKGCPPAERRRAMANFHGMHRACAAIDQAGEVTP